MHEKVKTPESPILGILTFSGIFGAVFAEPPKDSFWDFFAILGPEGPETPVNGRSGRNPDAAPECVAIGNNVSILLERPSRNSNSGQAKSPWIDSTNVDCPGCVVDVLLVSGSCLQLGASDCTPEVAFAS